MAGDEGGHQLVADLLARHLGAVLVACLEQHRQHVVAALAGPAALVDLLVDQLVRALARPSRSARTGPNPPKFRCRRTLTEAGDVPNSRIFVNRSRRASSRSPASRPKTARRMISSVSAWKRG